jgi:hypothetical protein
MCSINLKRPLATLAVFAALLAVAGPASASSADRDTRIHAAPISATVTCLDQDLNS